MTQPFHAGSQGKIWGLTGGAASGKSTVARMLTTHGYPILDADQLSRELSAPGGLAAPAIQKRFGTLDRAELRKIVFSDPNARKDLEAILHPLIRSESQKRLRTLLMQLVSEGKPAHVFYEATLLIETHQEKNFDGLVVVHAPLALRRSRLISRDQISPELADQMLNAQATDEQRLKAATHVIQNLGTLQELEQELGKFLQIINTH